MVHGTLGEHVKDKRQLELENYDLKTKVGPSARDEPSRGAPWTNIYTRSTAGLPPPPRARCTLHALSMSPLFR